MDSTLLIKINGVYDGLFTACATAVGADRERCILWEGAAVKHGVPLRLTRPEGEAMRHLEEARLVESTGETRGRTYRLTVRGALTAASWYNPPSVVRATLRKIERTEKSSKVFFPGTNNLIALGADLIPSAGKWWATALKSDKAWLRYQEKSAHFQQDAVPLLACGLVWRYVALRPPFWAFRLTDAGRAALSDWPEVEPITGDFYAMWEQAFRVGLRLAATPPPETMRCSVPRLLPATRWT